MTYKEVFSPGEEKAGRLGKVCRFILAPTAFILQYLIPLGAMTHLQHKVSAVTGLIVHGRAHAYYPSAGMVLIWL